MSVCAVVCMGTAVRLPVCRIQWTLNWVGISPQVFLGIALRPRADRFIQAPPDLLGITCSG